MAPLPDEVFFLTVAELSKRIKARQLSPVALTEGYLERLERIGAKLNAVVTVTRDLALKEAKAAEAEIAAGKCRGPLHGIPYGVKDLLATKGDPDDVGRRAVPRPGLRLRRDGRRAAARRRRGAGRQARDGRAGRRHGLQPRGRVVHGPGPARRGTRRSGAAARSSGPGAAVAAGLVPFAIGSETSGSILTPSAFCGVTGLRPDVRPRRAGTARWRCAGRSTSSAPWRARPTTAASCWPRSPAGTRLDATSLNRAVPRPRAANAQAEALEGRGAKGCVEKVQPAVRENFEASLTVLGGVLEVDARRRVARTSRGAPRSARSSAPRARARSAT